MRKNGTWVKIDPAAVDQKAHWMRPNSKCNNSEFQKHLRPKILINKVINNYIDL